jgi:FkbM family methyltransferase
MFPPKLKFLRWLGRQTWIARGRDGILRAGCNPELCEPYAFEVEFFGFRYRGDLAHYIDWQVFMYGSYAYSELSLLKEVCLRMKEQGRLVHFYDVGANAGQHSLFMSRFADYVYAFEPYSQLRGLIEEKVRLNHIENVKVFPVALGSSDEELQYFPSADRNSGRGTLVRDSEGGFVDPISIQVRNGDVLITECGLPRTDIIKIDTEGFEPYVLLGLSEHIFKDRPVILMELNDKSRDRLRSELDFRRLFYDHALFAEVGGRAGCKFEIRPFRYETSHEILIVPPEWADVLQTQPERKLTWSSLTRSLGLGRRRSGSRGPIADGQ